MKKIHIIYPEKIGTIAPEIYGHMTEHIGGVIYDGIWVGKDSKIPNIRGFRKDLVEKLKKISPAVVRWPGGCFAETYHWYDGVGENRPVRPSFWTCRNQGRLESNEVGTHEFMDFCEMIGAKPYLAIGVTAITPMEARDWMDYCISPRGSTTLALEREKNGHPEPFEIPYWGIGNENWGDGGNMTPEEYALEYRRFTKTLDNMVVKDPRYQFIVGGANGRDFAWTHGVLGNLANSTAPVQGYSAHFYTSQEHPYGYDREIWYKTLNRGMVMEDLIERHYAVAKSYKMEEKAKLVIDEWGIWYADGTTGPSKGYNLYEQQSTIRDAVFAAMTLNIFNNECDKVRMANIAQLCNNLQSLFLAGGEHCVTTPTYHVFDLYKGHQNGEALKTVAEDNVGAENAVSVSASVKDGRMTVTLANLSYDEERDVELDLLGAEWQGLAKARILASPDKMLSNTFENPDAIVPRDVEVDVTKPINLPAASVLALEIEMKN